MNIRNNKGMVILIVTYLVVAVLLILGVIFFSRSFSENVLAARQKSSIQALSIAEGGVERAIYDLRQDFENDPSSPSWSDGDINGISCGPNTANFYTLYSTTSLGTGSYIVELKNVEGKDDEIWIKATSTVGDINKIIQAYLKIVDFNPWNNAIFAGVGSSGTLINGNVDIRGSVHILGDGLQSFEYAMDMSGSGNIGNNYQGMPSALLNKIPACPTTMFNGESVESLDATVRIKNGLAGLSGTATMGDFDVSGNQYKETVDGVYITDGYGGNQGAGNVYSDNGAQNVYDLGNRIAFPSLQAPYQSYPTYLAYLQDNALVISDPAQLNQLSNMTPNSSFSFLDPEGKGSISMDGNGNLNIDGIIYVDGGSDLNMRTQGPSTTITYSGSGSILVTGDVDVKVDLVTNGNSSFPDSIIGVMTPNTITFDGVNRDVMGLFYAEEEISCQKQTDVAGTFISNYFDMGQQVPSVYQVPEAARRLPRGLISGNPIWIIVATAWQEL